MGLGKLFNKKTYKNDIIIEIPIPAAMIGAFLVI